MRPLGSTYGAIPRQKVRKLFMEFLTYIYIKLEYISRMFDIMLENRYTKFKCLLVWIETDSKGQTNLDMPIWKKKQLAMVFFHCGDYDALMQVYLSWAIRQRSRSCKVLMIMNYTLPDTEFITLNSQPQYGSNQHISTFWFSANQGLWQGSYQMQWQGGSHQLWAKHIWRGDDYWGQ